MRLGIDLGGTKIEIIALDDRGDELYRERVSSPKGDYDKTLETIVGLVSQAESFLAQTGSLWSGYSREQFRIKPGESKMRIPPG